MTDAEIDKAAELAREYGLIALGREGHRKLAVLLAAYAEKVRRSCPPRRVVPPQPAIVAKPIERVAPAPPTNPPDMRDVVKVYRPQRIG